MKDKLLDLTDICLNGITLLDGQIIDNLCMNVSYGVYIHEEVDIQKMEDSINRLLNEIDSFSVHIKNDDGKLFYEYGNPVQIKLEVIDLFDDDNSSLESKEYKKEKVQNRLIKKTQTIRDRESEIPVEFELYRLEKDEYFLATYLDHYISDGHSIGVTLMKLMSYYTGTTIQGGISEGNMHDYIKERLSDETEKRASKAAEYWNKELDGYVIEPYVLNTNDTPAFTGNPVCLKYDKRIYVDFAKNSGCTVGNLIMAVYHLALKKTFGTDDNVISYVSTDRNTMQQWGLIAPFVKTLNHRIQIDEDETVEKFIKRISKISGKNLVNKDAHIRNIGINRYGLTYMNHSKLFLEDPLFSQWMPPERMDCVEASFLLLRAQELENTIEVEVVCNAEFFNKTDYERFTENYNQITKKLILLNSEDSLKQLYIK